MREVIGYCCALLIGISLGLIGGGGSILTVPVLVYLFNVSPLMATSYSLCIVGVTSLVGAYHKIKHGDVDFTKVISFGVPSVITVIIIRKLIIPHIPEHLFYIGSFDVSFAFLIMTLFALLMLVAAIAMMNDSTAQVQYSPLSYHETKYVFYGIGLGMITGLLGAGGGFLIIPCLVLFVGMPMKKAVGTSLLIIAVNALLGFFADVTHYSIHWTLLLIILAIAIVGVIFGGLLSKKIHGEHLKKAFGWFVFLTGLFILIKEIFFI